MSELESRIADLEVRLVFQDDTLQALNDVVAAQQMELEKPIWLPPCLEKPATMRRLPIIDRTAVTRESPRLRPAGLCRGWLPQTLRVGLLPMRGGLRHE